MYNKIRSWLMKISNDNVFTNKVKEKINTYTGQEVDENGKTYTKSSALQWATGKVIGRGQVRSYYDNQEFVVDRPSDYVFTSTHGAIRWDNSRQGYVETPGAKYTEYGVYMKRKKGKDVSMSATQAQTLIDYISDRSNFWNLVHSSNEGSQAVVPGTSEKFEDVRGYIMYIRDTFVMDDFRQSFSGGLMPKRSAGDWILGMIPKVNEEVMDEGDPRRHAGMVRNVDFTHPSDLAADDDMTPSTEPVAPTEEDLVGETTVPCESFSDRGHVVLDTGGTNPYMELWDGCKKEDGVWYKKSDTYRTGSEDLDERAELVRVNEYEYLSSDIYGKALVFGTGGSDLLGPYAAQTGLIDGYVWPHLELAHCTTKCKVAMYHHDSMAPLIWTRDKDADELQLQHQHTAQLILDEEYLNNVAGGISNPYHDEYTIVDPSRPGLIDISKSRGTTMYLSKPHFYSDSLNTYERYGIEVGGLEPDGSKHNSRVYFERATGALVRSNLKLQYNLLLPPIEGCFGELDGKNLKGGADAIVYPLYWVDEESTLTEAGGKKLDSHPIYALQWIQYTLIPMSIFMTMALIGAGVVCIRRGAYMIVNPSMRVNEAGMRYHQWMHSLHLARGKEKDRRRAEKEKRKQLEKRIKNVMVKTESSMGVERKKHHADHFNGTTSPFHNKF